MRRWFVGLFFALASFNPLFSFLARGHDGPLDVYGCHMDQDQKYYHCHKGPYTQLSFDSKAQMTEQLKRQYLALGRTWPYGDTASDQERQIRINQVLVEQKPAPHLKATRPNENKLKRLSQRATKTSITRTNTREIKKIAYTRQPSTPPRLQGPELKIWIAEFRADGRPLFETPEGERFFLDDLGNKITITRRQ
jgi:hypothetical protein